MVERGLKGAGGPAEELVTIPLSESLGSGDPSLFLMKSRWRNDRHGNNGRRLRASGWGKIADCFDIKAIMANLVIVASKAVIRGNRENGGAGRGNSNKSLLHRGTVNMAIRGFEIYKNRRT